MDFIYNNISLIVGIVLLFAVYYLVRREGFGYTWFQVVDLDEKHKKHSMKCDKGCSGECNFQDGSCNCGTN